MCPPSPLAERTMYLPPPVKFFRPPPHYCPSSLQLSFPLALSVYLPVSLLDLHTPPLKRQFTHICCFTQKEIDLMFTLALRPAISDLLEQVFIFINQSCKE